MRFARPGSRSGCFFRFFPPGNDYRCDGTYPQPRPREFRRGGLDRKSFDVYGQACFSSCSHAFRGVCGIFHGDKQRRRVGPFDAGGD